MSLLWAYNSAICDGEYCPNDCDRCYKADLIAQYGSISLERVDAKKAKPVEDCPYPECEKCDKYHGGYCTVPMVVSKQIYRFIGEKLAKMEQSLIDLEELVTDEILGAQSKAHDPAPEPDNLTWSDYLSEESE